MVDLPESKGVRIGRVLMVIIALGILGIALLKLPTYLISNPWPTPQSTTSPPSKTPAPYHPPIKAEFDVNASYGFDEILYAGPPPHFLISRGKSFTVVMTVTSQSNRTLGISINADLSQVPGVDVKFEPQTFSLNPKERMILKMTLTVSPTAPTTTLTPSPTLTPTPMTPVLTPEPLPTPPPAIPYNWVKIEFYSEGSIIESTGISLTII